MAATVREYGAARPWGTPVVKFNVGCFPWHGRIELSILTAEELSTNPVLQEPGEMAAWYHYNFGVGLTSWDPDAAELGRQMLHNYNAAVEVDKPATVEAFLRACASAAARPEVAAALGSLVHDPRFKISVDHPDHRPEFSSPENAPEAA